MTFFTAADRPDSDDARREGLFARMIRLWIEHNQRMIEFGIRPH